MPDILNCSQIKCKLLLHCVVPCCYKNMGLYPAVFSIYRLYPARIYYIIESGGIYLGLFSPFPGTQIMRRTGLENRVSADTYGKAFIVCCIICLQETQLFTLTITWAINGAPYMKIPGHHEWCRLLYNFFFVILRYVTPSYSNIINMISAKWAFEQRSWMVSVQIKTKKTTAKLKLQTVWTYQTNPGSVDMLLRSGCCLHVISYLSKESDTAMSKRMQRSSSHAVMFVWKNLIFLNAELFVCIHKGRKGCVAPTTTETGAV